MMYDDVKVLIKVFKCKTNKKRKQWSHKLLKLNESTSTVCWWECVISVCVLLSNVYKYAPHSNTHTQPESILGAECFAVSQQRASCLYFTLMREKCLGRFPSEAPVASFSTLSVTEDPSGINNQATVKVIQVCCEWLSTTTISNISWRSVQSNVVKSMRHSHFCVG